MYKTYSTGTAAQQVKYDGHELRLIDDEESDCDQPSTSGSVKGLSVNIVRLKPRAVRNDYKKTESRAKTVSNHVRHRPNNDSDESVLKANAEVMQITVKSIVVNNLGLLLDNFSKLIIRSVSQFCPIYILAIERRKGNEHQAVQPSKEVINTNAGKCAPSTGNVTFRLQTRKELTMSEDENRTKVDCKYVLMIFWK